MKYLRFIEFKKLINELKNVKGRKNDCRLLNFKKRSRGQRDLDGQLIRQAKVGIDYC